MFPRWLVAFYVLCFINSINNRFASGSNVLCNSWLSWGKWSPDPCHTIYEDQIRSRTSINCSSKVQSEIRQCEAQIKSSLSLALIFAIFLFFVGCVVMFCGGGYAFMKIREMDKVLVKTQQTSPDVAKKEKSILQV